MAKPDTRVAIYGRVSTRDKGQEVENQLAQLREFAAKQGWTISCEYADRESGANPTSTVFRVGGFVFYNLRFFSSLRALTCQALCPPPAPIGVCAPVPASLRPERVPGFRASKSCAGVGP